MAAEGEVLDWSWINARRDGHLSDEAALKSAPASWRSWVEHGVSEVPRLRRRVLRRSLTPTAEQTPGPGREGALLQAIYEHYEGKKVYFESLAAEIAARIIAPTGTGYTQHGVTRGSGDFGIDFIAQLDIGEGFTRTPLVVLGQAKCVAPGTGTNAKDLARTVARLRRGWLGVFVTTGVITERAQREVFEDRYPLVMIPGRTVAATVQQLLAESGNTDVNSLAVVRSPARAIPLGRRSRAARRLKVLASMILKCAIQRRSRILAIRASVLLASPGVTSRQGVKELPARSANAHVSVAKASGAVRVRCLTYKLRASKWDRSRPSLAGRPTMSHTRHRGVGGGGAGSPPEAVSGPAVPRSDGNVCAGVRLSPGCSFRRCPR